MNPIEPLGRKAIDHFKAIYFEEFGEQISDADAQEMGARLLGFCEVLLQQMQSASQTP